MASLAKFWSSLVRWQKNTLIASCVLAVYALVGFTLLPRVLHHILVTNVAEALHRPVSVEEIRCNPLALTLDVRNLRVAEQNRTDEFVGLDGLHADIELASAWRLAIVLKDIRLDGPRLHIRLDEDGQPNFADLTATTPEDPDKDTADTVLIPVIIEPFSIGNGTVVLEDGTRKATHVIDRIDLRVPRFSSRKTDWETFMTPSLSFRVNGAPLTLQGRTIPFHDSLKTQFDLSVVELGLPQYWPYVPASKDLKLAKGTLTLNNTLVFEQHEGALPTFSLQGSITGQDLELTDQGDTVFSAPRTEVVLDDISITNLRLGLKSVTMDSPFLKIVRLKDGTLNWAGYFATPPDTHDTNATAGNSSAETAQFLLFAPEAKITNGRVAFRDETLPTPFAKEVRQVDITVTDLSTAVNATTKANAHLETEQGEKIDATASFSLTPFSLAGSITAQGLKARDYTPYFQDALPLRLTSAVIDAGATLSLASGGTAFRVDKGKVTIRDAALAAQDNAGSVKARRIALDNIAVDLDRRAVKTGELLIDALDLTTSVDADGRARIMDALDAPAPKQTSRQSTNVAPTANGKASPPGTAPAWTVHSAGASCANLSLTTAATGNPQPLVVNTLKLSQLAVDTGARQVSVDSLDLSLALGLVLRQDGSLDLANLFASTRGGTANPPTGGSKGPEWTASLGRLALSDSAVSVTDESAPRPVRLDVDQISLKSSKLSTDLGKPVPLDFSCRVQNEGSIAIDGDLTPGSVTGKGTVKISKLPLAPAAAYAAHAVNIGIPAGRLDGDLAWTLGPKGAGWITGGIRLDGLRVTEGRGKTEIAAWRSLDLRDISVRLSPLAIRVGRVDLIEPKAVFMIDRQGKTTLDRIAPEPARPATVTSSTSRPAPVRDGKRGPSLDIGTITLKKGRFSFADKTVSPQFESVIAPLDLTVSGFSLDPKKRSELKLSAMVDGSAPVTVSGWISPLRTPLEANSTISVRNLNLTPLSPYSAKFIAYPIIRGQLDWDLDIGTQANNLAMGNAIKAHQLELGNKVPSPEAADVPVKLGLSLLRDMAGDIPINLPIKGDLTDPKFSIGGIVMQAFLGLIIKTIASPFSILASLVPDGGNQDISRLPFPPGLAVPAPETLQSMHTLAGIMAKRPGLAIVLNGRAAMAADREGLEDMQFRRKLQVVKFDDLSRGERRKTTVENLEITEGEYADLLWQAYKNEPVEKEKNAFGLHREVPREVQEAKLRELIHVTDKDLIRLAASRAEFVHDYLVRELKIDPGRVALGQVGPASLSSAAEVALEVRQ